MGNESGTWVMYGVDWDDPECIHSVDEAIEYINEVGRNILINTSVFKKDKQGFAQLKHFIKSLNL